MTDVDLGFDTRLGVTRSSRRYVPRKWLAHDLTGGHYRDMGQEAADADGPAVFTFDRDGNVSAFPTLAYAAGWMEAIDVDDDEYAAVYTIDGRIVQATTANESVILTVTDRHDEPDLRRRLDEIRARDGLVSPADDTVAIANELMRREWENRWPKWPRWLPRLRPSQGPPQITPPQS